MIKINGLVSIIVPIYNAEQYLRNCIGSIITQTYQNFELILIDDGSTDNSRKICEEYASRDKRIKVLHHENQGPSITRNRGITMSRGKFIQFVDADDQLDPSMIDRLLTKYQDDVDLIICGHIEFETKNGIVKEKDYMSNICGNLSIIKFIENFPYFYNQRLINSPCNKLYKAEIIKNNKLLFPKDIQNGEDFVFNLNYLKLCQKIKILPETLYFYYKTNNENSLTKAYKPNYFTSRKLIILKLQKLLMYKSINEKKKIENRNFLKSLKTKYLILSFTNLFHDNSPMSNKDRRKEIKRIIDDPFVAKNMNDFQKITPTQRIIIPLVKLKFTIGIFIYFYLRGFVRWK